MSTDLAMTLVETIHHAGHHIATDVVHGVDQGVTKATTTFAQKAVEYGYNMLTTMTKKKVEERKIIPSETPDLGVLRDVVSASQNTSNNIKIDLLAILAVKAAQNDTEFYTKTYVDKIEQMSPNAAKCMRMFVNYPNLSVLNDYRDMLGQLNINLETEVSDRWLNNNSVRLRFSQNARKEGITPEIAFIGFSELKDLGLISGDNHRAYHLTAQGIGLIRALQIRNAA